MKVEGVVRPRPKTPAELAAEQLSKMRATKTVHFADSAPSAFSAVAVSGPPPKVPVIPMTDSLRAEMDDDESDHRESNRTFTAAPQPVYDRPQPVQPHVDDTIYTPGALQTIVVEADATRQEDTRPQEPPAAYESYDLMF